MGLEITEKSVDELIPYENNPRRNDDAVEYVANSIKEFGFKNPILLDENDVIIAGHTRLKAAKKLGIKKVPCIYCSDLTDEQVKAFRLADNKVAEKAGWDFSKLELEMGDLLNFDMSEFGFDGDGTVETNGGDGWLNDEAKKGSISDDFIIPPTSVFNCRSGEWQSRKKAWLKKGIEPRQGRSAGLLGDGLNTLTQHIGTKLNGTSTFDPVLCEIIYKWFCIEGGVVYDPFAGGTPRGIVADYLGYKYTGIDLSGKQVESNKDTAERLGRHPVWINDDSRNVDKYVEDNSVDLVFSCPPYYDLEVYSDDVNDLSNMEYDDFIVAYNDIISKAIKKLKNNRFAVFVVGDVRDKKGFYRNFVSETIDAFQKNGAKLYNQIVLIEQLGTAPLRMRRQFNGGRKVVKSHQNVLVFYKGDPKKIKETYGEVEVADIEVGEEGNA